MTPIDPEKFTVLEVEVVKNIWGGNAFGLTTRADKMLLLGISNITQEESRTVYSPSGSCHSEPHFIVNTALLWGKPTESVVLDLKEQLSSAHEKYRQLSAQHTELEKKTASDEAKALRLEVNSLLSHKEKIEKRIEEAAQVKIADNKVIEALSLQIKNLSKELKLLNPRLDEKTIEDIAAGKSAVPDASEFLKELDQV